VPEGVDQESRRFLEYVAARVRRGREILGLTQEQFAERAGFDPRFFRYIERGTKSLTVTTLVRLGKALGVPPSELLQPTRPLKRKPGRPKKVAGSTTPRARR
jgi:transcriptional regulator with XRE-family HTH domain